MTRNICNKNTAKHAIAYLVLLVILLAMPLAGFAATEFNNSKNAPYATLYPSSMYGVLYRFNDELEGLSEMYPQDRVDTLLVEDFELHPTGYMFIKFECGMLFILSFGITDNENPASDWEWVSLGLSAFDAFASSESELRLAIVCMSLFKACNPNMSNEEAFSMVTVLLSKCHKATDVVAKEDRPKHDGLYYDLRLYAPGGLFVEILR